MINTHISNSLIVETSVETRVCSAGEKTGDVQRGATQLEPAPVQRRRTRGRGRERERGRERGRRREREGVRGREKLMERGQKEWVLG